MKIFTARLLLAAYALDLTLGDREDFPHPVRAIGAAIARGERLARRHAPCDPDGELFAGALLAFTIIALTYIGTTTLLQTIARRSRILAAACAVLLAQTTLATRNLLDEVRDVADALERDDLPTARSRLARVVGRDTANLVESEIARAAIETLAESLCDGVIAPLCALAAGGVPAAMAFKAISTLDSMIGHQQTPYTYFGRVAARIDDIANFIPARLSALLIVVCAPDAARAWRLWMRDGNRHRSPNAGQCEAAMAGALGVRLGGTNSYDGIPLPAAHIGHEYRSPRKGDIRAALRYTTIASLAGGLLAALARRGIARRS